MKEYNNCRIVPGRSLSVIEIIEIVKPILKTVRVNSEQQFAAMYPEYKGITDHMSILDVHDVNGPNLKFDQRVITVSGGCNGCGDWSVYFADLKLLVDMLKDAFTDVWVVELQIDTDDDVYYVDIGIRTSANYSEKVS